MNNPPNNAEDDGEDLPFYNMEDYDLQKAFDDEIKPLVLQIQELARKHQLPMMMAFCTAQRTGHASDAEIMGDYNLITVTGGRYKKMPEPIVLASRVLLQGLHPFLKAAIMASVDESVSTEITGDEHGLYKDETKPIKEFEG
jgi:hypothetical protein